MTKYNVNQLYSFYGHQGNTVASRFNREKRKKLQVFRKLKDFKIIPNHSPFSKREKFPGINGFAS